MAYLVRNKTNQEVILPSPVSRVLKPGETVNLADTETPANIAAIAAELNRLEQAGKIEVEDVADTEDAIAAAAEVEGLHPLVVRDAMAEEIAIQIPAWNGNTASAGVPKTMKLCITDDGGSPSLLGSHKPTMTLTVSGVTNAKISAGSELLAGATDTSQILISQGIGEFTIQGDAGTMDIVVSGSTPVNPVTGVALAIINNGGAPYQVTIS